MTDQAGALVEETAYYPFGAVRHTYEPRNLTEPYQFTQKERDAESGLHYFEARYLAGNAGRFISVDPLYAEPLQMGGEKVNQVLSNPQDFNLYAYARNNPIRYTDPTGYDPKDNSETLHLPTRNILPWKGTTSSQETIAVGHGFDARPEDFEWKGNKWDWKDEGKNAKSAGYTTVPKGTTITFYCEHGQTIGDDLGSAIETRRLNPKQFRITFYPGDKIPNYALLPPGDLSRPNPLKPGAKEIVVDKPTSLSEILKPGMGAVHWAACRGALDVKPSFVDTLDYDFLKPKK